MDAREHAKALMDALLVGANEGLDQTIDSVRELMERHADDRHAAAAEVSFMFDNTDRDAIAAMLVLALMRLAEL